MHHAIHHGTRAELKISKHLDPLKGTEDWLPWYQTMVTTFAGHAGGRLLYLLEEDPSTTVEAYRHMFAPDLTKPITKELANAHREQDIVSTASILDSAIDTEPKAAVSEFTTPDTLNGIRIWSILRTTYGEADAGSAQKAIADIHNFKLKKKDGTLRTPQQVSSELKTLFNKVVTAGGAAYSEHAKCETLLRIFNTGKYKNMRTSIQVAQRNGTTYTFDRIISHFVGEDAMPDVDGEDEEQASSSSHNHKALRTQVQQSGPSRSHNQAKKERSSLICHWCNFTGHTQPECNKKKSGQPPHPQSKVAQDR
ncbi:hypothetical protein V8E36_007418, partial [Tilletia maclaganii]